MGQGLRLSVLLGLLGLLAAPVMAAETIKVPSNPIPTAPGARPAPVLILLHGCGGLGRNMDLWVRRVNDWGYAAFVLLSFQARQIRSVCAPEDQPKVTGLDRAGDVLNAALVLQGVPGLDGGRIGVIGFSHGGGTTTVLTRRAFEAFRPGLIKAVVNYYGPCTNPEFHGRTPMLALNGSDDNWGDPPGTCKRFADAMRADQVFELHTYPGAAHDFDSPSMVSRSYTLGHPAQYDAAAAADSFERTRSFLDRYVKAARQ